MNLPVDCLRRVAQVFPLAAEDAVDETEAALAETLAALPEEWVLLRRRQIGDAAVDAVLVHPNVGVALIHLGPEAPEAARAELAAWLERERFPQFFEGDLPIVAIGVEADEIAAVGERLEAAFAAAAPLGIGDPDWADAVVELLLVPSDVQMTPTSAFAASPESPMATEAPPEPRGFADAPRESGSRDTLPLYAAEEPYLAAPLRAEFPIAYEPPSRQRPGRVAAIAVAAVVAIGGAIAAWTIGGSGNEVPTSADMRQAEVQMPLASPPPAAAPAAPSQPAQTQPPPLPMAPSVLLAAKPLAAPPPGAPQPTKVAPLPEMTAEKAPAPSARLQAALAPPPRTEHQAATEPARAKPKAVKRPPTAVAGEARHERHPVPRREAKAKKPAERKPVREARVAPEGSEQLMQRELGNNQPERDQGPPVDLADLPPLPSGGRPSAPPARAQAAAPIGPPIRLVGEPAVPPLGGSGNSAAALAQPAAVQRECRPYTSSTTLTGRAVTVQGIACRDGDGQWHLVSEVPTR
jgi:hypothetical protein